MAGVALEVGAMGDALGVFGLVAHRDVGEAHNLGHVRPERGDVGTRPEPHDQVAHSGDLWMLGEERGAGYEARLVAQEDQVHVGVADPDDGDLHRRPALDPLALEVERRDEREPVAHSYVELFGGLPVDQDLVAPTHGGDAPGYGQWPVHGLVQPVVAGAQRR